MPTDLLGQIHSSTAVTSPDWATFRGEVTGMYLLSGQGGEWDSQHLIREYNRNINSLYTSWTPTEPNATGLFLEPYNAGFSYQGTGDFRDYKWDTYSLAFDGTDDYVITPYVIGAISTFTISCWAKGTASGSRVLVSDMGSDGTNKGSRLQIAFDEKTIYVNMGDGTNFYYAIRANTYDATSTLFDGDWHHVVVTIDTEIQKFYIDGALVHTHDTTDAGTRTGGTSAVLGTAGTYPLAIGRWGEFDGGYWSGGIDEVAIWESVLSAAQILAIYNGGTPESLTPYSPTAWWRMGDGPLDDGSVLGNGMLGDMMDMTLGSELVVNGTFATDSDWTKETGWTISGGKAIATEAANSYTIFQRDGTALTVGKFYKAVFTISNYSEGTLNFRLGNTQYTDTLFSSDGTHSIIVCCTDATRDAIGLCARGVSTTLDIDNFSVKEFNGSQGAMENMTASDIVADTP